MFLPETFKWGLTIDAMGYEGNLQADGAGPSFWNNFLAKVDQTNENGINHYYEYETDLAKAKELGANMYIVYVPWWRLAPSDTKTKNAAAFNHYDSVINHVISLGMEPVILFDWDYPLYVQDAGAWKNRETINMYVEYVSMVADHFKDRVKKYIVTDPHCVQTFRDGAATWLLTPETGISTTHEQIVSTHYMVVADLLAAKAIKEIIPGAEVGVHAGVMKIEPEDDSDAAKNSAQLFDLMYNKLILDPFFLGKYPDELVAMFPQAFEEAVLDGDLAEKSVDFIYAWNRSIIKTHAIAVDPNDYNQTEMQFLNFTRPPLMDESTQIALGGFVDNFTEVFGNLQNRYGDALKYIYVRGGGIAFLEYEEDLKDVFRMNQLRIEMKSVLDAANAGVRIAGYVVEKFIDGFTIANSTGHSVVGIVSKNRQNKVSAGFVKIIYTSNGRVLV